MNQAFDLKIEYFQRYLLIWYVKYGRHLLPWRATGLSEYKIIIAEILLQRTRAETVEKMYYRFIGVYPDWNSIISGGIVNLEENFKPIGLYRQRASRLMALAKEMVKREGKLPENETEYDSIPMFGQYIINAIRLQIFNERRPLLDVNMARVLERYFGRRKLADIRYDPFLQNLAATVINHSQSKELSWAILDFAAIICKARNPKCAICSLSINCDYFKDI